MDQEQEQEQEREEESALPQEIEEIQQVAKIEQKLEKQLSENLDSEKLLSTLAIVQKNLELMQQTVSLVVQRVEGLIKLHTDQTAQVLNLVENLEKGIAVVTDQATAQEEQLTKLAQAIEALTVIEENLREDLAAEQEEGSS